MLAVAKATSALFALQATKIKAPNFHLLCPRGAYDGNGNLKSDSYKSISTITYNHLNLPKLITFSSGNTIEIIYDASGNKLRKIVKQGATVQYEQDYSGGIEYRKTPAAGTFRIEAIYHEEGRYFNLNVDVNNTLSWRKEYALRDHLGSTRLLFSDKDGDGMVEVTSNASTNEVLQENHYYPFGLSYGGSHWMNDAARDNGYKYNGKELNEDWGLGWYDYGARWYMQDLGRWGAVDPLAEKMSYSSPYGYGFNNPVLWIDIDGLIPYPSTVGTLKKVGSSFGPRIHPISGEVGKMHYGIDLSANQGTNINAYASGKVVKVASDQDGWGNYVVIEHKDGYFSLYAHIRNGENNIKVKEGQEVKNGENIAEVGSTGASTGPHLHLEVGKAKNLSTFLGDLTTRLDPESIGDLEEFLNPPQPTPPIELEPIQQMPRDNLPNSQGPSRAEVQSNRNEQEKINQRMLKYLREGREKNLLLNPNKN
ncbi:MAG: hypothetical protein KIPDCIKN_01979 [Haliscomenobacter sp.]|nr:hypothetical protein [Haliscomenobacter sp.]